MTQQKTNNNVDPYYLMCMVQHQQNIPHRYNANDYFGGCMRIAEENTAHFLNEFINGEVNISPNDFDKLESLLIVSKHSGFRPIKSRLSQAWKKYYELVAVEKERLKHCPKMPEQELSGGAKYMILNNKKKMHDMSSSDMVALGEQLYKETDFSTRRIKDKFNGFVLYKIDMVLSGRVDMDAGFDELIGKYGLPVQRERYRRMKARSLNHGKKETEIISEKQQPNKPSSLFGKISYRIKSAFNIVKRPLIIGGLAALSLIGGKKTYDALAQGDNYDSYHTEYVSSYNMNRNVSADTVKTQNITPVVTNPNDSIANEIIRKTTASLQHLKNTNPADKNMDVSQVTNNLYKRFGKNTPNVVMVCKMAPYALNEYTRFNLRPTTHNMIEYLSDNNLTSRQSADMDVFIIRYMTNMKMQNQR